MADKTAVLPAVLLFLSVWSKLSSASHDEDPFKSPLDLSYIFNDVGGSLFQDSGFPPQKSSSAYSGDPEQPSSGGDGGAYYGGTPNDGGDLAWNQYANSAGDAQYDGTPQSGAGGLGYSPPQVNNPPYRVNSGREPVLGGSDTLFQPLDHIFPVGEVGSSYGGSKSNPPSPQQGGEGSLTSFGHSLPGGQYYPAEGPSPSSPDAQYFGDGQGDYQPAKRQILPDPYSGLDVPYSVKPQPSDNYNGDGGYHAGGNPPYPTTHDVQDDANYRNNDVGYGDGGSHSGGDPQGSYLPEPPTKDLSDILFPKKPSSDPVASNPSLATHDDPYAVPANGAYYPEDHVGGDGHGGAGGGGGGGPVVGAHPYPGSGVGGQDWGVGGGSGAGGGVGGGYIVVPNHSYPTDAQHYRDNLQCGPQFFLQYDHDFSGAVWQDVKGQVQVQQGRAVFQGHGFLAIPFFACNDLLPRYSMIFLINPSSYYQNGGQAQAVLGNSLFSGQASLLVAFEGQTLTLVVRQRAPNLTPEQLLKQCQSHHPDHDHHYRRRRSVGSGVGSYGAVVPSGSPFDTGLPHYGSGSGQDDIVVLQLRIGSGEAMVTIAQENGWIFFSAGDQHVSMAGRLPTLTNEALYVGAGADPRGGGELAHYTGTFDSFLFEKCS